MSKKLRVLILGGGPSSEHEVSLKTAEMVAKNLDKKKYEPILAIIAKSGKWPFPVSQISKMADMVFIAMHGEFGEDGQVQKILEKAKIPFTGSDSRASALGMDKEMCQVIFKQNGLNVPELRNLNSRLSLPAVIKPADRGSSVGISIVRTASALIGALKEARATSKNIIAQEFIEGTELTCGVLDDSRNNLMPTLPTEIVPKMGEFFDYKSKYAESGSEEITPARVSSAILKEAQNIALKAHVLVGCSGFSRTDMIWSRSRNKVYVLEINTIPGLTAQSLLPKAAKASGISFPRLLDMIISSALVRFAETHYHVSDEDNTSGRQNW